MAKKSAILIISAAAIFAAAFFLQKPSPDAAISNLEVEFPSNFGGERLGGEMARVLRVVDGDTIEVEMPDGTKEKVRYIGIDTPELTAECLGKEAAVANALLVGGKTATLVRDVSDRDKYGRLLRYVYVGDIFVNLELVRRGYAQAATYLPDVAQAEKLFDAEHEARAAAAGFWGGCR